MSLYSAVGGHWLGKPRHPAPRSLPGGLPAGFPEVDLPFGVRVWRKDQNFAISSQHVHRLSGPRKESSRRDDFTKAVGRLLPAVPVACGPVSLGADCTGRTCPTRYVTGRPMSKRRSSCCRGSSGSSMMLLGGSMGWPPRFSGRGGRMWGPVPGAPGDGPGRTAGDGSRAGSGRAGQDMAGPQFVQPPLQRPG